MKRILILALTLISLAGFSQSCPVFNPGSSITKLSPGLYKLTVNFNGNGQKHLNVVFFEGPPSISNIISTTCIPIMGTGTVSVNFASLGNDPRAVIVPGTGNCGGGSPCPANAITVAFANTGALPVQIESFNAKRNNNVVTLNWKTLSEINSKEFILQKNAGNGFVDVKTIPASNRSNGASYVTTDINQNKGITLYRLIMVDRNGSFTVSESRSIKGTAAGEGYTVFPNPASGAGRISISDISELTDVQIIDNTGRIIRNVTINNNFVELNNINTGIYQLRIHTRSTGTVVTRKLIITQ